MNNMNPLFVLWMACLTLTGTVVAQEMNSEFKKKGLSGNPVFTGWYADPEGIIIDNEFWIFPTYSAPYDQQLHLDAFSSKDLVTWTKHERIIDQDDISWLRRALWAPAIVEKDDKFYLFFGANDVHEGEIGGIGVAVADQPAGPYRDLLGKPLIGRIHNGAQPIDQFVFQDKDGQYYMIYGGWSHCNIAKLQDDFTGFIPFDDGTTFKEITPEGYVEGPIMFRRDGKYYFMWSEGGWGGPHYSVAYAIADSPLGPFKRIAKVIQQDPDVATGAGHHSVIHDAQTDIWYAIYHRRPLTETDANHRVTCIERMTFDERGYINPIKITYHGVPQHTLNKPTTYTNPILDKYLADPCLRWDGDHYYLFATGGAQDGRFIPIYRSPDLVNWEFIRGAVARGGKTDWNFRHFWAPEVIKIDDAYHLYYTATPDDSPQNSGNRVGLAISTNIEGPYEDVGVVIPHASIDGHPFMDRDGTLYLFYTIEHLNADGLTAGQIYVDRMITPTQPARKPVQIISHHRWQEGPWLQSRFGTYFLTYSCGGWTDDTYHVRYATGDSPLGPFVEQGPIILKTTDSVKGPGHHSMFQDRQGKDWIVYHGWDPKFTARYPRIDRIFFSEDNIRSDGPTSTPQFVNK